jgi:hypothetical protein
LAWSHDWHHDLMDALGNDSAFVAKRTSETPSAIMARALSALSDPTRALRAAFCQVRAISRACRLLLVLVERKTRRQRFESASQIEYEQNQFGLPFCR